jgi:Protein of unknown function (DUF3558)
VRVNLAVGTIAAAFMLVAGCGASTGASSANPPPASSPIPPVKNPRDITALAGRPCELLTVQQAKEFGLGLPPKQYNAALGNLGCMWDTTSGNQDTIRSVLIDTFTNNPTLEVAYNKDQNRPFFALTEIAGYPAIVTRTNANMPVCDIHVKPAERQSFSLTYESQEFKSNPQQSCEVGKQVAAAVLMNLPLKS